MLSETEAAFVRERRLAHLATADTEGWPHAVPICFVYLGGFFYSAIDEKPKKQGALRRLRNIRDNPRAALIFDSYDEDWSKLGWVLVRGAASILERGAEHDTAVAALTAKYPQYKTMTLAERPLIKITSERVASWGQALSARSPH